MVPKFLFHWFPNPLVPKFPFGNPISPEIPFLFLSNTSTPSRVSHKKVPKAALHALYPTANSRHRPLPPRGNKHLPPDQERDAMPRINKRGRKFNFKRERVPKWKFGNQINPRRHRILSAPPGPGTSQQPFCRSYGADGSLRLQERTYPQNRPSTHTPSPT